MTNLFIFFFQIIISCFQNHFLSTFFNRVLLYGRDPAVFKPSYGLLYLNIIDWVLVVITMARSTERLSAFPGMRLRDALSIGLGLTGYNTESVTLFHSGYRAHPVLYKALW